MLTISHSGDKPLKEALLRMHTNGITSLPVLDNQKHVVGNISHVDVKVSSALSYKLAYQLIIC